METFNSILDFLNAAYDSVKDFTLHGIPYLFEYLWYWLISLFADLFDKLSSFIIEKIIEWGLVAAINAAIGGIPAEIIGTLGFLGFDDAIKIILGAYLTKLLFSRLMSLF
jgi:hypothetical protein